MVQLQQSIPSIRLFDKQKSRKSSASKHTSNRSLNRDSGDKSDSAYSRFCNLNVLLR